MKRKSTYLTGEERDILVLGGIHPNGKQLSNAEIGQHLGLSVNRVKTIIHQACVKLKAHNRNEAILFALIHGEICLDEIHSLDEIAELCSSLGGDMLRRIAHIVGHGLEHGYLLEKDKQIVCTLRRQDTKLTKAERDVVILAGCGLTNREIANRLYVSNSTVRTFIYRACAKLGACRRADAVELAMKQGEISALDIFSPNELIQVFAALGAESTGKIVELVTRKLRPEHVPTGNSTAWVRAYPTGNSTAWARAYLN